MLAHLIAIFLGLVLPTDTPGGPIASINTTVPVVSAAYERHDRTTSDLTIA